MSHIQGNAGSVQGLRRRVIGVDYNKTSSEEQHQSAEVALNNTLSEDSMDDLVNVELGRKLSVGSSNQSDAHSSNYANDSQSEEILTDKNELKIEGTPRDNEESVEEFEPVEEYEPGEKDKLTKQYDKQGQEEPPKLKDDRTARKVEKGGISDEEDETRVPLKSRPSGRASPVDSDGEVECVYLPMRVAVAAGHLRETAGHLREHLGETAGHLREQIGEQAGHLRESIGEQAGQIVHLGEQLREQVGEQAQKVVVQAERVVHKVKDVAWRVTHHNLLPDWLKDNDFLHYHHRPPLPSFRSCFKSIFRIHTETGNIWTHMLGCVSFVIMMIYFLVTSILSNESWDKIVVYMAFFIGAITCLGFSWLFHTCSCHSDKVSKIFCKLDYSGISLLIVGSFIPWLYFGFYCQNVSRWIYISLIIVLGTTCLVFALKDKFAQPQFRPIRAGLFIALGLSAVVPALHFSIMQGFVEAFTRGSLGWMVFMGSLYIGGALLYAMRIPERFFPGKCDLMVQSHQIFHVMVVAAAFVHYHGLNVMAVYREEMGECIDDIDEAILPYTSQA